MIEIRMLILLVNGYGGKIVLECIDTESTILDMGQYLKVTSHSDRESAGEDVTSNGG
jgi:hypothetical protein